MKVNIRLGVRREAGPLLREHPVGYIREGVAHKRHLILNVNHQQTSNVDYQIGKITKLLFDTKL